MNAPIASVIGLLQMAAGRAAAAELAAVDPSTFVLGQPPDDLEYFGPYTGGCGNGEGLQAALEEGWVCDDCGRPCYLAVDDPAWCSCTWRRGPWPAAETDDLAGFDVHGPCLFNPCQCRRSSLSHDGTC